MAEAFSVGVRDPGDLMLMYGSTMFIVQMAAEYHTDPALWTTNTVQRGTYALAAGTATAGSLIDWLQNVPGNAPFDELTAEAAAVPPGSEGVVMLPYRSPRPGNRRRPEPAARTGPPRARRLRGHRVRCREILEVFDSAAPSSRVVAVGGGLQSPIWAQAVSDITGRTQLVPEQTIDASFGGALMAAVGVGLLPRSADWTRIARTIEPDPHRAAMYHELYQTWRDMCRTTKNRIHRLTAMDSPEIGRR